MNKNVFTIRKLHFDTKTTYHTIDITKNMEDFIKKSGIQNGKLNIQTFHTTTTVVICRNGNAIFSSFRDVLDLIAPINSCYYEHDDHEKRTENMVCDDECINGHSHLKASLLPVNISLEVNEGNLQLGLGEKLLLIELDQPRSRNILAAFSSFDHEENVIVNANNIPDYNPGKHYFFNDITEKVKKAVAGSGIENGHVNIETLHRSRTALGTASVIINEKETGITNDLRKILVKAEKETEYINHIKALHELIVPAHTRNILPTQATLNLIKGQLQLGTWQRIMFMGRNSCKNRDVQITITGE